MKKYLLSSAALVVAIIFAAFTYPKTVHESKGNLTDFYYRFDGSPGDENIMANWTQISKGAYDSLTCAGTTKSCKITNNTNTSGHPTSVPLNASGLPQQGAVNTLVVNKN